MAPRITANDHTKEDTIMAGYNHPAGMSNNAVRAYSDGIKPLSKITRADLDHAGLVHITLATARALAKSGAWRPAEWHHSGGTWYNKVDFYDAQELAQGLADGDIQLPDAAPAPTIETKVRGRLAVWGGTRKRPTLTHWEEFEGHLRGAWIHLVDGRKKKAAGNHIVWFEVPA